jgi:tripeptidyl-peptidase-1
VLTQETVTAVGSTFGFPERVAPFSAGGFSNTFDRPTYQDPAVTGFLSTIPSDFPGMFNKGGRGYPDVALQGVNFQDFIGGALNTTSGTSASAPAFAALVALLNAQLISEGQSSLGFLNRMSFLSRNGSARRITRRTAFIYNVAGPADAFNDITVGNNTGLCSPANTTAFSAVTGWDATTGELTLRAESERLMCTSEGGVLRTSCGFSRRPGKARTMAQMPALGPTRQAMRNR